MITKEPILLYDGVCNLCDSFVSFIIRHDTSKMIMFSSLQSDTGKSLLVKSGLPMDYIKSVVYIKGNRYYTRSSAVLNILKDLGGRWRLFYGFVIIPGFIRDFLYYVVAGIRYRIFGKKAICHTPQTSHLTPHSSHLTPNASRLLNYPSLSLVRR